MFYKFAMILSIFVLLLGVLPYSVAICITSRKYRISENEAMKVVDQKCQAFFMKAAPILKKFILFLYHTLIKLVKEFRNDDTTMTYPLYFGYNGAQFVLPCIDETFSEICKEFGACYCSSASFANDCSFVIYSFAIQRKPNPLSDEDLEPL